MLKAALPAHDLISLGCCVRPGHLPDPSVPIEAVRCPKRWLWLRADKQRPLRAGFCYYDHKETCSGEAAEPCLAVGLQVNRRLRLEKVSEIRTGWRSAALHCCWVRWEIPARVTDGWNICITFLLEENLGGKAASTTKRYAACLPARRNGKEMEKRHRSVMTKKELSQTSVKALKAATTSSPRC